jgi:hypothetical protein
MKKIFGLFVAFTLVLSIVGCSSADNNKEENKVEEKAAGLTEQIESKIYNTVRVAELKVNEVFHKAVAADEETPIINPSFADEATAVGFLSTYYSEEVAKEIYSHYATADKTAEGQMIVKADTYFTPSFLETTQDSVTIEGDDKKSTVKTDGITYTVELKDEKYIVTGVEK